jgi:hypothetical protein
MTPINPRQDSNDSHPEGKPHATTEDQIGEMESEGQGQGQGTRPTPTAIPSTSRKGEAGANGAAKTRQQ